MKNISKSRIGYSCLLLLAVTFSLLGSGGNLRVRAQEGWTATPETQEMVSPISESIEQSINWLEYVDNEFGYKINYPSSLNIRETADVDNSNGVPSDKWFGESMHIITRIPGLPNETIGLYWGSSETVILNDGTVAVKMEIISEPNEASYSDTYIKKQYLVEGEDVDYFITYESIYLGEEADAEELDVFDQMVMTFSMLPERSYVSPNVSALAASATDFDFFVDPPNGGTRAPSYTSYNANNGNLTSNSGCYNKPYSQLQHTAEDWFRMVGTPVYSVANGRVIYIHPNTYPGNVIIIEHTLGNGWSNPWGGNIIYSVYAHVNSEITQWSDVSKGQRIGTIIDYPNQSTDHIHFEMRRYADMTGILVCPATGSSSWPGPGYTNTGVHPDTYGYTNPSAWIDAHRSSTPPPPTCSNYTADQVVLYADANYSGSCVVKGLGDYSNPGAMGIGNDSLSSIKVGGNVKLTLCKDDNYLGGCETFQGDDPNLGDNGIGDNQASSAKVESRNTPSVNWTAKYFNGADHWWDPNNYNNQMCQENINGPQLDKNYGSASPCNNGVNDNWVAEYTANINFSSGNYVLQADHDDGMKVWLNNTNIMDAGGSGSYAYICPARSLSGSIPIRVILREEGGDARVKLTWTTDTSVCNRPGDFDKAGPLNGATGISTSPTLTWGTSSNASEYYYCIDTSNNNNCDASWQSAGNATSKSLSGLSQGTTYYWHVRSNNSGGETFSNTNAWWSFTTQPAPVSDDAAFVSQSVYPTVTPGQAFQIYFQVRNTGTSTWQPGSYWLQNIQNPLSANAQQPLSQSVAPNGTFTWTINQIAPSSPGTYRSQWFISHNGTTFGPNMFIDVTVQPDPASLPDLSASVTSISPSSPYSNDDIRIYYDVKNISNNPSTAFRFDIYIDNQPTGCSDWGDQFGQPSGLAANNSASWRTIFSAGSLPAGTHQFWIFVDSRCELVESNENNNIIGPYLFTIQAPPSSPPHDDIGSARVIGMIRYSDTVDVRGATRASDDPGPTACTAYLGTASVWYKYSPAVNTSVILDTFGSNYDTVLSVWTGTRGSLTPIICNDDISVGTQSTVQVNMTAGTTYYVQVAQYSNGVAAAEANAAEERQRTPSSEMDTGQGVDAKEGSDVTAQAGGTLAFHATYALENSSWYGGAVVSSDRIVVAVGRPHIGSEVTSYGGFSNGSTTQYVPMLFKQMWSTYDSALYIQNTDTANSANISIKFYDSNGILNCTKADTISAQSSKGYWLPSETCLPANWYGGVVVTSDRNIVAVGRPHIGNQVMTYNGFSSGSTTMNIPMLFKNQWGYDSAFYVQNTDGVNSAAVTIKFYDANGTLNCTKTDTIPKLSSHGYWLPSETCLPASWNGGVVVTADKAIVAVGRPHLGSEITTYNGFAGGSTNVYAPMLFKRAYGTYDSALYIQNVDPTNTANVTIKFYNTSGVLSCTQTATINPGSSKGYWLPDLTCLSTGWAGSVKVESDRNVVAIARPHLGSSITAYDGFTGGGTVASVPMLFKQMWGSYDSALYIENTDSVNAANVTTRFYDVNGNLSCVKTDTIGPLATLAYWLPSLTCSP